MFCIKCGRPYDPNHRFCNYCGEHLEKLAKADDSDVFEGVPSGAVGTTSFTKEENSHLDSTLQKSPIDSDQSPEPQRPIEKRAPFLRLTVHYVGLLISFCAAMTFAGEYQAFGGNESEATALSYAGDGLFVVAIIAAISFAALALRSWRKCSFDQRAKRIAFIGALYLLFVATLSWFFGDTVGQNRRTFVKVSNDIDLVNEVGKRIGTVRSQEMNTIPEYISAYKQIEADVEKYELVNRKLEADLQEYEKVFPDEAKTTRENLTNTRNELRRTYLLKRQIATLKEIEQTDPSLQVEMWRSSMIPLFEEENKLD